MGAEEITFGLNTLLSIIFGAGGALGVWFKLKGSVNLLTQRVETLEGDKDMLNGRIDRLKEDVKENREKSENSTQEIGKEIREMELRIIKAIHDINK